MQTATMRMAPGGTFCQSSPTPKKASAVGTVANNPTLKNMTQRLPLPPWSLIPARIVAATEGNK